VIGFEARRQNNESSRSNFASRPRNETDGDHNTPQFSDEGARFIFVGNVSSGRLHFENSKRVSLEHFKVGATLGIPTVVDSDEPFCFQRHVAILKPDRKKVDSRFVWHMLGSRTVTEKAGASTTGSAQPTIPLRAIRELPIPVPTLPEQRRIVTELDALQAEVDALKRLQAETAGELDALFPACLPALLDHAWTPSLPARSGFALSLCEIRLARSQRARLKGEL
jgi:type I restriction enzyme, S subunit